MDRILNGACDLRCDAKRVHADAINQVPRERLLDQKFRWLSFFDIRRSEICCRHGSPVELAQLIQLRTELRVNCARVRHRERPAPRMFLCPSYHAIEIGLKMHDWPLTACI